MELRSRKYRRRFGQVQRTKTFLSDKKIIRKKVIRLIARSRGRRCIDSVQPERGGKLAVDTLATCPQDEDPRIRTRLETGVRGFRTSSTTWLPQPGRPG